MDLRKVELSGHFSENLPQNSKFRTRLAVVVHTFNPSSWKVGASEFLWV